MRKLKIPITGRLSYKDTVISNGPKGGTVQPSYKDPQVEFLLRAITGRNRAEVIAAGKCMTCMVTDLTPSSFVDDLSRDEYTISGMCQTCQDKVFGVDPFDISQDYD